MNNFRPQIRPTVRDCFNSNMGYGQPEAMSTLEVKLVTLYNENIIKRKMEICNVIHQTHIWS